MQKQIPLATTTPTGSATIALYEETVETAALSRGGYRTLSYRSENDESYTLNFYGKSAGADSFVRITQDAVSASSADNPRWKRWDIRGYRMVKVEVVNGGTDQTTWKPTLVADTDLIGGC